MVVYHVYVVCRIPLSLGTPRAASMRAAIAAAAKASCTSGVPFCEACRNMEKLGKQNREALLRVPPCTWVWKAPAPQKKRALETPAPRGTSPRVRRSSACSDVL